PTSVVGAPAARKGHCSLWTGEQLLIWGGIGCEDGSCGEIGPARTLETGGIYDVASDSWTETPLRIATPSARASSACAWTGDRMLVWSGDGGGGKFGPAPRPPYQGGR